MSFLDKLKHKADELHLQEKANELAEQAKQAAQQAKEKAGELAHENRERIGDFADKAGHTIDEKTGGKYTDKIAKAKEQVTKGVDKVAEGRPVHDVPGPVPPAAPSETVFSGADVPTDVAAEAPADVPAEVAPAEAPADVPSDVTGAAASDLGTPPVGEGGEVNGQAGDAAREDG